MNAKLSKLLASPTPKKSSCTQTDLVQFKQVIIGTRNEQGCTGEAGKRANIYGFTAIAKV
jgi:hypothetical protein